MTQSILVVSYFAPSRGHAGGLRLLDLYEQIRQITPGIRLDLLAVKDPDPKWNSEKLDNIFNNIYEISLDEFNEKKLRGHIVFSSAYDVIDFQYHQAGALIAIFKKHFPFATIIFSPMESQVRALMLGFWVNCRSFKFIPIIRSMFLALQELTYCMRAGRVGCVSLSDLTALEFLITKEKLFCIPTGLSRSEIINIDDKININNSSNKRLIYLAYFGSETNREALRWFCRFVHPIIKAEIHDYELMVVGRGMDDELLESCKYGGINFIGEVKHITSAIRAATAGIAPALSGAGVRGKIHQYASLRVPTVTSSIGASSLEYKHGESILIANSPEDFAECCVQLLTDQTLVQKMGKQAQQLCLSTYSWDSMNSRIKNLYCL
ncbi:MAG: glycosyltransferase [Burkholderiales bacterium]|nr:glycosyltransferase [Burkholderiales bacterium]